MQVMTLDNAAKNFAALPSQVIDGGEIINVATEVGNIILISEEQYNCLLLTAEVNGNAAFKESLFQGLNAPLSDFVSEDQVEWDV